jgi:hypothetical protein
MTIDIINMIGANGANGLKISARVAKNPPIGPATLNPPVIEEIKDVLNLLVATFTLLYHEEEPLFTLVTNVFWTTFSIHSVVSF